MKKLIFVSALFLLFGLASHALAQGFVPLAKIPGLTETQLPTSGSGDAVTVDLAPFFNNLYKYCIGFAAVLAVIMIIWGGLEISTQDSISKQGAGRERITQAILGLILVLSPVLVFSIINPRILNLSLPLPPINLEYTPYVPTVSSCPPGRPMLANGECQVNAVSIGLYDSAQRGGWCYAIVTDYNNASCPGGCNYSCGNETQCRANLRRETPGTTVPTGASCALY